MSPTPEDQHWAKLPVDRTTMAPADTTEPLKIQNADGTRYNITIGPKRLETAARAIAADSPLEVSWEYWGSTRQHMFRSAARAALEGAGFTVLDPMS